MRARFRVLACAATLVLLPTVAPAQSIAEGDTVHLRLLDRIYSHHHRWPAPLRAIVIAPVVREGRVVIPPGSEVEGWVTGAGKENFGGKRHWLGVRFDSLKLYDDGVTGSNSTAPIGLRILTVDDSRESVDGAGRIVGPAIPSIVHSKRNWAVLLLAVANPVGGAILGATVEGDMVERHRAVALDRGVEMTTLVTKPTTLDAWPRWTPPPPISHRVDADAIAASAPMRTFLHHGGIPSDVISAAVIGSQSQVSAAFAAAGWTRARPHNFDADLLTVVKAAEGKGYEAQPVSELVLEGRPPDVVFEKVADTFTKRHHFRIWRWPVTAPADSSSTVWLIAATHDTGMMFSTQRHTFTHRVDPDIDLERDKVVSDLVAANVVAEMSYVPRAAPASGATVNGRRTPAVTDWRMAVIVLR